MDHATNPGNRPRKGIALLLSALVLVAVVAAAAVVATPDRAAASGLEAFTSCRDLSAWGDQAQQQLSGGRFREQAPMADDMAGASGQASSASEVMRTPTTTAASSSESGAGAADQAAVDATNVVVDGVDELDLVDRLGGDRVLVVAGTKLAIVDLGAAEVLATRPVPSGAQVTYDADLGRAWVVGQSDDGGQVQVSRVDVGASSLVAAGTWGTPGMLVDARRVGDQLHLVAADGFTGVEGRRLPFGGGPVPCDQVLHPNGPSEPAASLLVTLPVTGELTPVHAAEVVGSGQLVHVTDRAAYLATPQWSDEGDATTSIHRFDLSDLSHTGSGSVPGTLLDDFSMSDHDGYLRVAITASGGRGIGGPMVAIEDSSGSAGGATSSRSVGSPPMVGTDGSPGVDFAEEPAGTAGPVPGTASDTRVPVETVPETTVPQTTVPGDTTTTSSTTTTVPVATTSTSTSTTTSTTSTSTTTTTAPSPGVTIPGPGPDDPVNKVVVLDTEGSLDVVGSTPWFGHPGEQLHGIRFDGTTAYAVTFLQTDPFYVLDLADPAAPAVAGEVQLPGFSSYLHPVGKGRVIGFGPGESGRQEVKLFDVSDPAAPTVADSLVLGDDSPVAFDHHAFVDLGDGRFAVPVTTSMPTADCAAPPEVGPNVDWMCAPDTSSVETQVVEIEVDRSKLVERNRVSVRLPEPASRAIPTDGGWAVLGGTSLAFADDDGHAGPVLTI